MNKDFIIFILFLICVILGGICLGQKIKYEWIIEQIKYNIKRTKAEAIKESAERLRVMMFNYYECVGESAKGRRYKGDTLMDYEVVDMIEDCIDNFVKEMIDE